MPEEKFYESTPEDLSPYIEAYKLRIKERDTCYWVEGRYTYTAVSAAIQEALNGRKSEVKYPDKPFSMDETVEARVNGKISEKVAAAEREKLLNSLKLKQIAFEMNKKRMESQQ